MGAWGPGLYSDDTTCEIRESFRSHLKMGLSHAEASAAILNDFESVIGDHQIACLVYFALADTQWKYGCLDQVVLSKALSMIEAGGDLAYWNENSQRDQRARSSVIASLKKKLLLPQPALKDVKKKPERTPNYRLPAPLGSVYAYPLSDGSFALLKLVEHFNMETRFEPIFRLLPWKGLTPPAASALQDVAEHWVTLSDHREFQLFHSDGRKNPLQSLIPTGIVLEHSTPAIRAHIFAINVEFFPQEALKALAGCCENLTAPA